MLLVLALALPAAEPLTGEAGLAELAAMRARVQVVAGAGLRTVQRLPDPPSERRVVRFAIAAGGRYDIVLHPPDEPGGERVRFVSDGVRAAQVDFMGFAGEDPAIQPIARGGQALLRRLFDCLRLDLPTLREDYEVALTDAGGGQRELRLVPRHPELARDIALISVRLDAAGRPLVVVLEDATQERQRLELTAFADDPGLPDGTFAVPAIPER